MSSIDNWCATGLAFIDGYRIRVELEHDVFGDLDLREEARRLELEKLLDPHEFGAAQIDRHGIVVWPSGVALDPTVLFERCCGWAAGSRKEFSQL